MLRAIGAVSHSGIIQMNAGYLSKFQKYINHHSLPVQ